MFVVLTRVNVLTIFSLVAFAVTSFYVASTVTVVYECGVALFAFRCFCLFCLFVGV